MPRLSKIGAAALAAFGWTGLQTVNASYLQVAGGGGGGGGDAGSIGGAGGGAGGYLTGSVTLNPTQSYTVVVGAGGAGATTSVNGVSGSNSQFGVLTASVGGGFGSRTVPDNGGNGGSGGGGSFGSSGGTGTSGQGSNGGTGSTALDCRGSGGGGGASAVGANGSSAGGGNGGNGTASSITGTSVTYAGGGGGGALYRGGGFTVPTVATGGTGGGGSSGAGTGGNGNPGTANLGGGGGGPVSINSGAFTTGGNGGSGVVIISYVGAQQFGGGVVTSSGGNTIHTFTTSGTLSPLNSLTASYLLVAGGAGGGGTEANYNGAGGGGAGGLLSGSGITIDTNSIYAVTVGAGGAGGTASTIGVNGSNSIFSMVSTTAVGGGGGGSSSSVSGNRTGANGGSGGGGAGDSPGGISGGTGTSGQGNAGGSGFFGGSYGGGGGGGAFAVGQSASATSGNGGGNGGAGSANPVTGSTTGQLDSGTYYLAGGGAGGMYSTAGTGNPGTGGLGGGGNGGTRGGGNGFAGTANTGGGGGGATTSGGSSQIGGNGGAGVVIITYPGSTQQMAGGTVTVAGGNVIHTFTSSGYLAPIFSANNSLRFRSSASAYLSRTFPTAGNRRTYTLSLWVKRGILDGSTNQFFFGSGVSTTAGGFYFLPTNQLEINPRVNNTNTYITTTQVFRDPSAWYHIVVALDTTQATDSNRLKLYVNGVQVTAFSATIYPGLNGDSTLNNNIAHWIGRYPEPGFPSPFDGYLAEYNFIDGLALTPNSFGTFNSLGSWQPIRYGGSYGTNGFYLPFTNTTSTTTLGYDFSPQGNNWTTNNISLTAGSTYDSMNDVPTLTSATTANYCVLNPLQTTQSATAPTNGNLTSPANAGVWRRIGSTMQLPTTGKFYFEYNCDSFSSFATFSIGVFSGALNTANEVIGISSTEWGYNAQSGYASNNSSNISSGFTTATTGDVLQLAYDASTGSLWFGKNNTWQGASSPNPSTGTSPTYTGVYNVSPVMVQNWATQSVNFGQRPFAYTPPTGYVALNTFNLTTPTIGATAATIANEYFDATTYTGTGSTQNITNSGSMQPDWVWIKNRSSTNSHQLTDSVRGVNLALASDLAIAEYAGNINAFNTNGFQLTGATNAVNASGQTYVAWQWRASNATAVTNTAGSITSTVSANTTAGFSVVTWTGNGSNSDQTLGTGLSTALDFIIAKPRDTGGGTDQWLVYTSAITLNQNECLLLNSTNQTTTTANSGTPNRAATAGQIKLWAGSTNNQNLNANTLKYVAYCFHAVAGYSAFGSYTGNGATDGPFVYLGFRPRFVMIKRTDSSGNWNITDTAINPYNNTTGALRPNTADSESTVGTVYVQPLSNGFKITNNNTDTNGSSTYIYACFAENPFKYANAR